MLCSRTVGSALTVCALFATGCVTQPPTYVSPASADAKAFVKFELTSQYPITVGQVFIFEGGTCNSSPSTGQKLFVRGRGNPLVSDINTDGVWLPAGKTVFLTGRAITSVSHTCAANATFTPRANVKYQLYLNQNSSGVQDVCALEVYEEGAANQSSDFAAVTCAGTK